jgi:hypothetical protein
VNAALKRCATQKPKLARTHPSTALGTGSGASGNANRVGDTGKIFDVPLHRIIIGGVALLSVAVCGLGTNLTFFEILTKTNEVLPEERQFSVEWWYYSKQIRLFREYRRLYPQGNLCRRFYVFMAICLAALLLAAWSIGTVSK